MAKDPKDPSTTSDAYDAMLPKWQKVATLLGGTDAMRAASRAYLPQHPAESDRAYAERLMTAVLFNQTKATLDTWTGKPFTTPLQVGKDVPALVAELQSDIDLQGNNLHTFARHWFREGLAKAFCHVLIDHPRLDTPEDRPRTLADDRREAVRPYMVRIDPQDLIYLRAEVLGGREIVTHARIREDVVLPNGFGDVRTPQIRVIDPGHVTLYRPVKTKGKKIEWGLFDEWDLGIDGVPLVTFYADREAVMRGRPPLDDLADLNITHWQSSSDQRTILTVARFPMLGLAGGAKPGPELEVGPHKLLYCSDPAGRYYYVEHGGAAIGSGRQDLLDLEERMSQLGADYLRRRPGDTTATAKAIDSAEAASSLQDAAVRFADSIASALWWMAKWRKAEVPDDLDTEGWVELSTDWGPQDEGGDAELTALGEARRLKDISRRRYVAELHRRDILSEDFDADENDRELEEESGDGLGPPPARTDLDDGEDDPNDGKMPPPNDKGPPPPPGDGGAG